MADTAALLKTHVHKLAGEIGERNVFCSAALRAAADYIRKAWIEQGYGVMPQSYEAKGVVCENLEITRWGGSRKPQIILLGVITTRSGGALVRTTMPVAWLPCSKSAAA